MNRLIVQARRESYGKDDVDTMTVSELIELLQDYDGDLPIVFSHDNGYTYGGIRKELIEEEYDDGDD